MNKWTTEVEYISPERVGVTGKSIVRDSGGVFICKVETELADLIASAPVMRAALKLAVSEGRHDLNCQTVLRGNCNCWKLVAVEAIDAAEGKC